MRRGQGADEDRSDQDLGRPAAVAEREIVGDDGDEPFPRTVDDARRHDAGRVAPEPHAHGQRLLAVRPRLAEQRVEVEGDARQVAEVLQQREDREEDRHRRQHDRHYPGRRQIDPVEEKAAQPPRQADRVAGRLERRVRRVDQQSRQQAGRHVRSLDGDPEDRGQNREHQREAEPAVREQPIQRAVDVEPGLVQSARLGPSRDVMRGCVGALHQRVVKRRRHVPLQALCRFQNSCPRRHRRCGRRRRAGVVVAELAQLAGADGFGHRVVGVQQALRHPADAGHARENLVDHLGQRGNRFLDVGRLLGEPERPRARPAGGDSVGGVQERVDACRRAGGAGHDRHAQLPLEPRRVDRDAMASGFVHQVDVDDHAIRDVENLQHEVQVAFEARGVDDHHGHVRPAEQDELASHLLVGAARLQRVGARQVDELHARAAMRERSLGADDGLAGPVAGVLPQAGEGVENRALAHVRVAGEGHEDVPLVGAQAEPDQALGAMLGAAAARRRGQGHQATSSTACGVLSVPWTAPRSTWIQAAWVLRSAIRAPRMR